MTRNARRALELLYDRRSAGEVARALGLSPAQAHRALVELRAGGHVTQKELGGVLYYRAGSDDGA